MRIVCSSCRCQVCVKLSVSSITHRRLFSKFNNIYSYLSKYSRIYVLRANIDRFLILFTGLFYSYKLFQGSTDKDSRVSSRPLFPLTDHILLKFCRLYAFRFDDFSLKSCGMESSVYEYIRDYCTTWRYYMIVVLMFTITNVRFTKTNAPWIFFYMNQSLATS